MWQVQLAAMFVRCSQNATVRKGSLKRRVVGQNTWVRQQHFLREGVSWASITERVQNGFSEVWKKQNA